jgi:hypothetical protein
VSGLEWSLNKNVSSKNTSWSHVRIARWLKAKNYPTKLKHHQSDRNWPRLTSCLESETIRRLGSATQAMEANRRNSQAVASERGAWCSWTRGFEIWRKTSQPRILCLHRHFSCWRSCLLYSCGRLPCGLFCSHHPVPAVAAAQFQFQPSSSLKALPWWCLRCSNDTLNVLTMP